MANTNKQKERRDRGEDFQDEMRRSWALVPNSWRLRITDAGAGTRPADEVVLLKSCNILAEHKRTAGDKFELSFLRPPQIRGLLDFECVLQHNKGLVFVSFLNADTDRTLVFRLVDALRFMKREGKNHIKLGDFGSLFTQFVEIPLMEAEKRTYYLQPVVDYCK